MHDRLFYYRSCDFQNIFLLKKKEKRNRFELKANNKYSSRYFNYYCFRLNQSIQSHIKYTSYEIYGKKFIY